MPEAFDSQGCGLPGKAGSLEMVLDQHLVCGSEVMMEGHCFFITAGGTNLEGSRKDTNKAEGI